MFRKQNSYMVSGIMIFLLVIYTSSRGEETLQPFNLKAELDRIRSEYSIPGMSSVIVFNGKTVQRAVSGIRKHGHKEKVEGGDAFYLCSVTKPVTSMLAHIMAEKKILSLKATLPEIFPELTAVMKPEYRKVNVLMLLSHRSCMPYMPRTEKGDEFMNISRDMKQRRYEYVKASVIDTPECEQAGRFIYGGGTIVVAAMMERKTGKTWEELVREYVFNPLNLKSAGFGPASGDNSVNGVWEHYSDNGVIKPVPWPATFSEEVHAPAGRNVYMSASDLAEFMKASFMNYSEGKKLVSRSSLVSMQQLLYGGPTTPGWFISVDEWSDWKTVLHYGDDGKSISALVFSPKFSSGFIIMANISGKKANEGMNKLADKIKVYLKNEISRQKLNPELACAAGALSYKKTVTASDVYYDMSEYGPSAAVDGVLRTRWATNEKTSDAWIEIDLGKEEQIGSVLIKEEFYPRVDSFRILVRSSLKESFREVYTGVELGDEVLLDLPSVRARYVRLSVRASVQNGPTISEFQVFSDRGCR